MLSFQTFSSIKKNRRYRYRYLYKYFFGTVFESEFDFKKFVCTFFFLKHICQCFIDLQQAEERLKMIEEQMKIEDEKQKLKRKEEKKAKKEQMMILGKDNARPKLAFSLNGLST